MGTNDDSDLELVEINLLLEGIFQRYGYDFRNYARVSIRRRIGNIVRAEGLTSISALQDRVLHDFASFGRLFLALTVNVTSMFRDPEFFLALRHKVMPILRSYPFVRIWCVGCSTGEEVYSLAIILEEEGLADRCRIYATDINPTVLQKAKDGIFPVSVMKDYTDNYVKAGGACSFSEYYTTNYGSTILKASLRKNIVFGQHNLTTDGSLNEFHLILCRNVMIYFNRGLQDRVHNLIYDSLAAPGILGLGDKESLHFTPHEGDYERFDDRQKLYQRVK